jgi:hypothetical protein
MYVQTTTDPNQRWVGDGSSGNPYRSLEAAGTSAVAGDVIYLKGGTHYPTKSEALYNHSGTASAPIRIESEPGQWAILDFRNAGDSNGIVIAANVAHVQIRWLEVMNCGTTEQGDGIITYGSNTVIEGCVVSNCNKSGIQIGGYGAASVNGVQVIGNTIRRTCNRNSAHTAQGGWPATLNVSTTINRSTAPAIIRDNEVYENHGEVLPSTGPPTSTS